MFSRARFLVLIGVLLPLFVGAQTHNETNEPSLYVGTYSIAAVDPSTGEIGVAVTSRVPCIGNIVPHVRPGMGVVVTQAMIRREAGALLLDLLARGRSPKDAIADILADDAGRDTRQIGVLTVRGQAAQHTGDSTVRWAGHGAGRNYIVQGNILMGPEVLEAVAQRFEETASTGRDLADRLIEALQAGEASGGDLRRGTRQSAAVRVSEPGAPGRPSEDLAVDIDICDHERPVDELRRVYRSVVDALGYRTLQQFYGRDVIQLKYILHALGYYRPGEAELRLGMSSAVYDQEIIAAVNAFREAEGMSVLWDGTPPGFVDEETVDRLWAALERRGLADAMRRRFRAMAG